MECMFIYRPESLIRSVSRDKLIGRLAKRNRPCFVALDCAFEVVIFSRKYRFIYRAGRFDWSNRTAISVVVVWSGIFVNKKK